jgi:hypothetical protein
MVVVRGRPFFFHIITCKKNWQINFCLFDFFVI